MRILDLFSGTGGFSLGLSWAGLAPVAFCENEAHAQRVIGKHWPSLPIYEDVTDLTGERLARDNITFDVITGGFPCQDISIGGKNAGINGDRSGLWNQFMRIIRETQPRYAIFENVDTLLSRGLNVILGEIARAGYDATYALLDGQYFGTPQRRRRVYLLCVRDGIPADADIFRSRQRSDPASHSKAQHIRESRPWYFEPDGSRREAFAYFTRQRSDEFGEKGVASTLLKRDWKDFTDLIVSGDNARRVSVEERLAIQGYPRDYFDGVKLSTVEKYSLNGMHLPTVQWVGECLMDFDRSIR